ncbi:metal-dependent transcriptional regulator [Halomarina pelagica]|uniref:metal-dependent transcriptional regulator n=1 Tax=Halomarina pelagica TaxID=2961599 RepID=UPI0020C30C8A|nr:metal-dependent transcriptional regulator [Halomarina sp. BND7]
MSSLTDGVDSHQSIRTVEVDLSPSAGRYLTGIYWLFRTDGGPVRTGDLGAYLDVNPASVTEMFSKLADHSLIEYEKHCGATLTEVGELVATSFARRQCIVTQFFCSVLGAELDRETAYDIGQQLPENGIRRLYEHIDDPCVHQCEVRAHPAEICLAT